MMTNANLCSDSQGKFWAEAVSCSNYLEDLIIKAGRTKPALEVWTGIPVHKWMLKLVEFGRIGVVNKREEHPSKMTQKGFPVLMVGYAMNHGPDTYRLFNPKTNRIIFSRDVTWNDFNKQNLDDDFDVFEPEITSDSSITTSDSHQSFEIEEETQPSPFVKDNTSGINSSSDEDTSNSLSTSTPPKPKPKPKRITRRENEAFNNSSISSTTSDSSHISNSNSSSSSYTSSKTKNTPSIAT